MSSNKALLTDYLSTVILVEGIANFLSIKRTCHEIQEFTHSKKHSWPPTF